MFWKTMLHELWSFKLKRNNITPESIIKRNSTLKSQVRVGVEYENLVEWSLRIVPESRSEIRVRFQTGLKSSGKVGIKF